VSTALGGFDKVTAVQRNGPGRYGARVDPAWDGPGSPLGGVGAATILRAMLAELATAVSSSVRTAAVDRRRR
jgi:hypothetical protein